ncbi:MAG: hypothetical protein ACRES4_02405, partial [Nevskiales bacterium]
WGQFYEMPLSRMTWLALVLIVPIPVLEKAFGGIRIPYVSDSGRLQRFLSRAWKKMSLSMVAPAAMALDRTIQAVIVEQETINSLVGRVKKDRDDKAFFKAVGFDPMALTAKPLQDRLALAVIEGDQKFISKLGGID